MPVVPVLFRCEEAAHDLVYWLMGGPQHCDWLCKARCPPKRSFQFGSPGDAADAFLPGFFAAGKAGKEKAAPGLAYHAQLRRVGS